jgi:hypothetical protein
LVIAIAHPHEVWQQAAIGLADGFFF